MLNHISQAFQIILKINSAIVITIQMKTTEYGYLDSLFSYFKALMYKVSNLYNDICIF